LEGLTISLEILITTIITSTAALVAIIGGFLVSRVITLSSEQNGIQRRIKEIDNEISTREEVLSEIETYLLNQDALNFIEDNARDIVEKQKSIEEIIKTDEYTERKLEELKPFVKDFEEAFKELLGISQKISLPESFSDFWIEKESSIAKPSKKEIYKIAYDLLVELIEEVKPSDPLAVPSYKPSSMRNVNKYYNDQWKEKERLEYELKLLKNQKEEQIKISLNYGNPKGVWGGMFVLIYSCIVGIIYPVTLLPYPENTYNDAQTKWFLITLFISELFILFIYLSLAIKRLTKKQK